MVIEVDDPQRDPRVLWRAYLDWLVEFAPQAAATLRPPATDAAIADLERLIGYQLPAAVTAGWRLHDGQTCETDLGVAFGFWWLSVAEVAQQWADWDAIRHDEGAEFFAALDVAQQSYPKNAIQRRYTSPGWIPLLQWPMDGDYIGLDFDPGPAGRHGQVINFGRDQESKFVVADDIATLLAWLLQEARAGRVTWDGELLEHSDGLLLSALVRGTPGLWSP